MCFALGLTLRTTLGIPRGSVGSEPVRVGSDRLALALGSGRPGVSARFLTRRTRRPRLAGRAGLARRTRAAGKGLPVGSELLLARRTRAAGKGLPVGSELLLARTTRRPPITPPARVAIVAITARTTAAASFATTTAEVARCGGELPADAGTWHLAATRPVVVLGGLFRAAQLEASEAARLVATATGTAEPAAASTAAAGTAATSTTAIAPTATIAATT